MNTRAIAAGILAQVAVEGEFLTSALSAALPQIPKDNDRAFVQALCYGVARWYWRLDRILALLTHKPIKDAEVRMLALLGLYQLKYTRVKPHAAVAETVAAVGPKVWAKPLLNGVLRNYQREQDRLEAEADTDESAALAHPGWLIRQLRKDWPAHYADTLHHNNAAPPLALRVNLARNSREAYLERLAEAGIAAVAAAVGAGAIIVETPVPVEKLPGFAEGAVSVQDVAAQLAAPLLGLAAGQRVLDVCAAPGGKTAHLLEARPDLAEVVAIDISSERLTRVHGNLQRLGLAATVLVGDATQPESWWDGRRFDRILVDAPCSATGVIRRHPDIKLLRRATDIAELAAAQARILEAMWPLLAPGGRLLYATCSVLKRENEQRIAAFLDAHPEARERPIMADWGIPARHGRQILAGQNGMDGFYYALLERA
ncbi:16S rRNA (cytosine967-C5)-methyltransferase [Methylomagnum ishizawai]|uniref:16S rRNA (cytosine(967)-C(5))-methyltransferase n=1 Tax=Methylomagnum ishizawai TaxID=1760988 RepID=A0A1Y6CV98_9GAMM|nr:16S rRNA (cytosine(967)-C(5))-methyltransferase RsmB [Methylomagnum ishizawai]SMF94140.1 16S rRNA (cytosine967-C5)-methyltransferase [Methylomagnum ishizawai]